MKKRVAIPVNNEQLSEYFGECCYYHIFETDGTVTGHHSLQIPAGKVVSELPRWLGEEGITDVITFKIDPKIIHLFASEKINLFIGVPVDSPENLIDAYLQGRLESDEKMIREITFSVERSHIINK